MFKKIKEIKNITSINKNAQSKIKGGNLTLSVNCFSLSQDVCGHPSNGCVWYGNYCGPNTPHIPEY